MGWSIGYDSTWRRDIGYGVPATCDHPGCGAEIDRGLGYVCGNEPYGGDRGCGLFFCGKHQSGEFHLCERCRRRADPFDPTPDVKEWVEHKLTHESWQEWRDCNPDLLDAMRAALARSAQAASGSGLPARSDDQSKVDDQEPTTGSSHG